MGLLHLVYFLAVSIHEAAWGLPHSSNNQLSIVGGHRVSIKDVPFIVSINEIDSEEEDEDVVICAGTIIHERFILTAASCFDETNTKNETILLGVQNLDEDGVYANVVGRFCHEDYDDVNLIHDICLLKVESDVPFAWLVKAVLPGKDFVLREGTLVNVTGWGARRSDKDMVDDLRQVTVPVLSQKRCDDVYDGFTDDQICAGTRRRDFCTGDMGGPMTIKNMQVGVISGSGECGKRPGYYTRVTSYLNWIHSTINNNL